MLGLNELTHWDRDKMAAIFQMTFSNAFSWMKVYKFLLRFHWSLFPKDQLTIFQHTALVYIVGWCRSGAKPLSEPLLVCFTNALGLNELIGIYTFTVLLRDWSAVGGDNALFVSSSVRDFFVVLQMYPVYSLESHLHQNDQLWQQPSNTVRCCYNTLKNTLCRHRCAAIITRYRVSLMGSDFDVVNASVITEVLCVSYLDFIIQRSCWGVYWFHSVHLSIRPSHPIKQLQKVCRV